MDIRFDHVVHFVKDPHETMAAFQLMGFPTVLGGNHEIWGTYNTLCYFKNLAYIEWIGINNLDVTKEGSHPFSRHLYVDYQLGEGLSQIAFRTSSIKKIQKHLSEKKLKLLDHFQDHESDLMVLCLNGRCSLSVIHTQCHFLFNGVKRMR